MCPQVRCGLCVTADGGVKASSFLETVMQIWLNAHICTTGPHLCSRKYLPLINFHLIPFDKKKEEKKKKSPLNCSGKNFFLPLIKSSS